MDLNTLTLMQGLDKVTVYFLIVNYNVAVVRVAPIATEPLKTLIRQPSDIRGFYSRKNNRICVGMWELHAVNYI